MYQTLLIGPPNWLVLSKQAFAGIVFVDYKNCLLIMFGCPSLNHVLPEISLSKSLVSFQEGIFYQTGSVDVKGGWTLLKCFLIFFRSIYNNKSYYIF